MRNEEVNKCLITTFEQKRKVWTKITKQLIDKGYNTDEMVKDLCDKILKKVW